MEIKEEEFKKLLVAVIELRWIGGWLGEVCGILAKKRQLFDGDEINTFDVAAKEVMRRKKEIFNQLSDLNEKFGL